MVTDILFLVERLESLVGSAKKVPLTNNVVLDQAAALELIDQLRVAVPDEVRQAKRITEDALTVLSLDHSVNSRVSYGGTAPRNVRREANRWLKALATKRR